MHRIAIHVLFYVMMAIFVGGCYFDVSTDSNKTGGTRTPDEVAGIIMAQFALKVDGVMANVVCPNGLSGQAGRKHTCTGTTSDGYTLDIEVLERGKGAFRWDVVESVPVPKAKKKTVQAAPGAAAKLSTESTSYVDPKTGQRCVRHETGYICIED